MQWGDGNRSLEQASKAESQEHLTFQGQAKERTPQRRLKGGNWRIECPVCQGKRV